MLDIPQGKVDLVVLKKKVCFTFTELKLYRIFSGLKMSDNAKLVHVLRLIKSSSYSGFPPTDTPVTDKKTS